MLCAQSAFGQKLAVTGNVTDNNGYPVIGASVLVEGTTNGTITDMDGNFKLSDVDRKSTRLNSSHANISYAVFCLKKKKKMTTTNNVNNLLPFTSRNIELRLTHLDTRCCVPMNHVDRSHIYQRRPQQLATWRVSDH